MERAARGILIYIAMEKEVTVYLKDIAELTGKTISTISNDIRTVKEGVHSYQVGNYTLKGNIAKYRKSNNGYVLIPDAKQKVHQLTNCDPQLLALLIFRIMVEANVQLNLDDIENLLDISRKSADYIVASIKHAIEVANDKFNYRYKDMLYDHKTKVYKFIE